MAVSLLPPVDPQVRQARAVAAQFDARRQIRQHFGWTFARHGRRRWSWVDTLVHSDVVPWTYTALFVALIVLSWRT